MKQFCFILFCAILLLPHTTPCAKDTVFLYENKFNLDTLQPETASETREDIQWKFTCKNTTPKDIQHAAKTLFPTLKSVSFPHTNDITFSGAPHDIQALKKTISNWDIPPRQIKFSLEFFEISQSSMNMVKASLNELSEGFLINYNFETRQATFPTQLQQTIQVLRTTQTASLIAKPSIEIALGKTSDIQIGDQIPYISRTVHADRVDVSLNQINTGILIHLEPTHLIGDQIQTTLKVDITSVKLWKQFVDAELPIVTARKVATEVRLTLGQPLLIAGLLQKETKKNTQHTPWIEKIPLLGRLFKSKNNEYTTTDVVILITAS